MKKALVLSGGGSRGALQAGMAQRLLDDGFEPDIVTGVSVGALNGALIALGRMPSLMKLWTSITSSRDIYRTRWLGIPMSLIGWQWGFPSLYAAGPIKKLIRRELKGVTPDDFKAELRVGAVELQSGRFVTADETCPCLGRMLAGSMAIPIAFPPVSIGPKKFDPLRRFRKASPTTDFDGVYVDGCVRGRTPIAEAIDAGADEIHVLLTGGLHLSQEQNDYKGFLAIVQRTIDVMLHDKLIDDIKDVLVRNDLVNAVRSAGQTTKYRPIDIKVYEPEDAKLQGLLDFDPLAIKACIELGYQLGGMPKSGEQLDGWFSTGAIHTA